MDLTGKPLKGWIFLNPEGVAKKSALVRYVNLAIWFVRQLPSKRPGA